MCDHEVRGGFLKEMRVGQALTWSGEHSIPPWNVGWERGEQSRRQEWEGAGTREDGWHWWGVRGAG